MTATLYPTRRDARIDIRRHAPVGDVDGVDYTARRLAAGAVAVLAVVVLAIAGSALFGALAGATPASASDTAAVGVSVPTVHVAQPGDTLWSIADRYRGPVAHGRYVDVLVDLNGGAVIQIGQAVRLP